MSHADQFIALNVGRGDAFYLERSGFSCLVDGGDRGGFASNFRCVTGCKHVDVVVCTHNDNDHAFGLIDFFKNGGTATQCWLPATWMEPLRMLLEEPGLALDQMLLADRDERDFSDDEGSMPETEDRSNEKEVSVEQLKTALEKRAKLPQHFDGLSLVFPGAVIVFTQSGQHVHIEAEGIPVIGNTTIRADRILRLAIAATRSSAKIRWFDPRKAPKPKEVACTYLRLVNASEVYGLQAIIHHSLPYLLYLTEVNRFSLVLHSPARFGPDVLFSSDSGFGSPSQPPVRKNMLVTAPHHGSGNRENEKVYCSLKKCSPSNFRTLTWVRSGLYKNGTLPGQMYLSQDRARRFCTNCRDGLGCGQDVIMIGDGDGCWKPADGVSQCRC